MNSVAVPPAHAPGVRRKRRPSLVARAQRSAAGPLFAAAKLAPVPVLLLILGLVLPPDLSLNLGALRLSAYRVVLIIWFVPAHLALFSGQCGRVRVTDWCMIGYALWVAISYAKNHGLGGTIEASGINMLESLGAYLIARRYVRTPGQFVSAAAAFVLVVSLMIIFTVPEAITGKHIIREVSATLTGGNFYSEINMRMGLHRAFGPFQHPILYGVSCASMLGLAWYALAASDNISFKRITRGGLVVIAAAASLSSGAIAAMSSQILLIGWDRATRGISRRWLILILGIVGMYVFADMYSNRSGIRAILSYVTFSPSTAYGRIMIWNYAIDDVWRNPLFGIGFNEWTRPFWLGISVDNFWLVTALRNGIPAFLMLSVCILSIPMALRNVAVPSEFVARLRMGWVVSMTGLIVSGATVHFWNQSYIIFCFLIGMGVCLCDKGFGAEPRARKVRPQRSVAESSL